VGILPKQYFYLLNFFCRGIAQVTGHAALLSSYSRYTETVKQNPAITYINCQYYLPIFITWSLLKNKVLVLRTWVG